MNLTEKAAMSTASINDLPDSAFAYIEPGGTVTDGRTEPRSKRHYPIHDKAHVRNALARAAAAMKAGGEAGAIAGKAMPAIRKAAKRMGIDMATKGSVAAMHSAAGADVLEDLYELISCEADEPDQVTILQQAAVLVGQWLDMERREIGQAGDLMEMGKARLGKAMVEIKAEPMDTSQLDRWLSGKIPRRKLVIPFTGPLPGGKAGLDLDGEYFDAETDLYGPFPGLRASRERMVDWHHDNDPLGAMKGVILGREVLDAEPESDGLWADWWANAGEKRLSLIKTLEERGVPLYGSSQAVGSAVRKADDGHIELWPVVRDCVTTSPQNTHAAVPSLKAILMADIPFDDVGLAALRAAMAGIEDLGADLRATSPKKAGKRAAKARRLSTVLEEAEATLARIRAYQQSNS